MAKSYVIPVILANQDLTIFFEWQKWVLNMIHGQWTRVQCSCIYAISGSIAAYNQTPVDYMTVYRS